MTVTDMNLPDLDSSLASVSSSPRAAVRAAPPHPGGSDSSRGL